MPTIELSTTSIPDTLTELGVVFEAEMTLPFALSGVVNIGAQPNSASVLSLTLPLEALANFGIEVDEDSVLRLDDEPNVFLSAEMDFGIEQDPDIVISSLLDFLAIFDFGFNVNPTIVWPEPAPSELNLIVDISPAISLPANFQYYKARFTIDGDEVPIESFTVDAAPNKIGTSVNVVLSNVDDRVLIVPGSIYKLEIGIVQSGVTTWYTLVDGLVNQDSYEIGWGDYAPSDKVTLGADASLVKRMNISPYFPVVLYDTSLMELDDDDFTPIFDTSGTPYPVTRVGASGLSLYTILNYAFSNIGLSWATNIPNFRIPRVDIDMGQSFYQAISGLFGVFNPLIYERDGVVFLIDASLGWPSGFGTPKTITPSTYKGIVKNKLHSDINGYIVQYNDSQSAWDSSTEEETQHEQIVTDIDENKQTRVTTTTTTRKFFNSDTPSVIVRQEIIKVIATTRVTDPVIYPGEERLINQTEEYFQYDALGKILNRVKYEYAQVPMWFRSINPDFQQTNGKWEYEVRLVREEFDEYVYKDNLYKASSEYREQLNQYVRELIYIDPDKLYETVESPDDPQEIDPQKEIPIDFKERYVDAVRGGNLDPEGEVTWGSTAARLEFVEPTSIDTAKVSTKEIDYLTSIIVTNVTEEQVGEYAVSNQIGSTRRAIVYGVGGDRDNRRMEILNIGEVPLAYGVALAQRKLARNNDNDVKLSAEIIGIDLQIKRGVVTKIIGRDSEDLGNFLTEGFRITGSKLGTDEQTIMTSVELVKI